MYIAVTHLPTDSYNSSVFVYSHAKLSAWLWKISTLNLIYTYMQQFYMYIYTYVYPV